MIQDSWTATNEPAMPLSKVATSHQPRILTCLQLSLLDLLTVLYSPTVLLLFHLHLSTLLHRFYLSTTNTTA